MHDLGGECVFASEIDSFARKTYEHNLKCLSPELFENEMFNDDIRRVSPFDIPDFDVLCAGFPCQPFSQAGFKRGFDDAHKSERGNLFFEIADIIKAKRPKAFFLENVRGIVKHDDGRTLKTIREILEIELGYSFYFKVVHASDYGLPQLRPRAFMIGFRNEGVLQNFEFPKPIPLKFNMSDVWRGECTREIGFTLRVGGRGSDINDRRNWDSYLVDGEVRKIMPEQARVMQGFPDDFNFPVPNTQAMKQLGNSVAVDAVKMCATAMLDYLDVLEHREGYMVETNNKGEWTELYSFLKVITDKEIALSDKHLNPKSESLKVTKVSTLNIKDEFYLEKNDLVRVQNQSTGEKRSIEVGEFLNDKVLTLLAGKIKEGKGTFKIPEFVTIQDKLGISIVKGGNSNQKSDIVLDITHGKSSFKNEGFGIKSYLGSSPILLNASGNTNFIFSIIGLDGSYAEKINAIDSRTKLIDRIKAIYECGGELVFLKPEKDTMLYNLSMVDSELPDLISKMMLEFFINRTSSFKKNIFNIYDSKRIDSGKSKNIEWYEVKLKRFLTSVLLGFFAGSKWDGKYVSNGTIVVKENGQQVAFHLVELSVLEDYLFENIKFDTPSTSRHRFGNVITENDGKLYFKLNLQLRF